MKGKYYVGMNYNNGIYQEKKLINQSLTKKVAHEICDALNMQNTDLYTHYFVGKEKGYGIVLCDEEVANSEDQEKELTDLLVRYIKQEEIPQKEFEETLDKVQDNIKRLYYLDGVIK